MSLLFLQTYGDNGQLHLEPRWSPGVSLVRPRAVPWAGTEEQFCTQSWDQQGFGSRDALEWPYWGRGVPAAPTWALGS